MAGANPAETREAGSRTLSGARACWGWSTVNHGRHWLLLLFVPLACMASQVSFCGVSPNEPPDDLWFRIRAAAGSGLTSIGWTADGGSIVFGVGGVVRTASDGSQVDIVKESGGYEWYASPSISLDGTRIVYATTRYEVERVSTGSLLTRNWELEHSKLNGSDRRRLTDTGGQDIAPSWSPSGDRVAFLRSPSINENYKHPDVASGLYVMRVDGSNEQRLASVGPRPSKFPPVWSPDGKHLAYLADEGLTLYIIGADGSDKRWITNTSLSVDVRLFTGSPISVPSWSPDGQYLAFTKDDGEERGLYVVRHDGSELRLIADGIAAEKVLWSPKGSSILVGEHMVHVHPDGIRVRRLENLEPYRAASWAPDGTRIAVIPVRGWKEPGVVLFTMDPDGASRVDLVSENSNGSLIPEHR